MRISAQPWAARPDSLRYRLEEVPHLTLEPGRACNLACRLCYTLEKRHLKTVAEIREELAMACRARRLGAVTLVGGEPTLHAGILDIVREIKSRGLGCQLLTNGVKFLGKEGPDFLRQLVLAGLGKVAFHVDEGMGHADVEAVRKRLFDLCEREGVLFSLSLTVYQENEAEIPALAKRYASYRYFDGILAVLGRDPLRTDLHGPILENQHRHIVSGLEVEPSAYVPSNRDEDEAFWLNYVYFIRADTGRTFHLSPMLHRGVRIAGRLLTGHYRLVPFLDPRSVWIRFLFLGVLDVLLNPRRLPAFFRMMASPGGLSSLRSHYIAIQRPPETDPKTGDLVFCFHCPDATVRNGQITPVCLADFIRPFDGMGPREELHARWLHTVDDHMGTA